MMYVHRVRLLLASCAVGAIGAAMPVAAQSAATVGNVAALAPDTQDTPPGETPQTTAQKAPAEGPDVADIVVTAQRLGFSTTSQIKRDAPQSVSVLTTSDLRNIPDTVLIDIVRRIPGVQVSQGGGGGLTSIRGLTQTEQRLNGRAFASATSRNFDIATLPGDLVSGVAVYKTPTPDQVDGGIAGIIDFRTRRPFDFDGLAGSLTAKGSYAMLDKSVDPVVSGYLSNRWDTGIGDVGILVGGSYQRQPNALNLLLSNGASIQTGPGGTGIDAPVDAVKYYYINNKKLSTFYGSLQWKPNSELEMVVDLLYNNTANVGGLQGLTSSLAAATPTGPFTLYPNSNIFRSGNYGNVPLSSSTNLFRGELDAFQAAYNATWKRDGATVTGDVSYTRSSNDFSGGYIAMQTTAPTVSYDTSVKYPNFVVGGLDPAQLSNYAFSGFNEYSGKDDSESIALRLDGSYEFDGPLRKVQAGIRYEKRSVDHVGGFQAGSVGAATPSVTASGFGDLTRDDLYPGRGLAQRQWAALAYSALGSDLGRARGFFGLSGGIVNDPGQAYNGAEKTLASYAMASFAFPLAGLPIDGNAGVRVVQTEVSLNATQNTASGARVPSNSTNRYHDVLPSINLRATLADNLFLRLSYSKQVTRPNFPDLAPIITLDFGNRVGTLGNAELKPVRANQYDASLEYYFGSDNSLYAAGFYKDVSGFIRSEATNLNLNGTSFLVTRPQNSTDGYIAGTEIGYRQQFTFLPGALSGLGLQGSYTFIDATKSRNAAGYLVPFELLSRNNYQISANYRKYGVSANVNWVWRSRILERTSGDGLGRPDYRTPFGQLDANLIYQLTPKVNLLLSGVNLTQSVITRSFVDRRRFYQDALENRRILAGIQIKLGGGI